MASSRWGFFVDPMKNRPAILLTVLAAVLAVSVAAEHVYRRAIQRRYGEALRQQQQLSLQFGEALAGHEQLKRDLTKEQQHGRELFEALASLRTQLEEAVGRLGEQTRTVRTLESRLTKMQQYLDQLQGELALTLEDRRKTSKVEGAAAVQLDRVVVSGGDTTGLEGRVISVHEDWRFVVVNLGWDAVKIGDTISIFRGDQFLAKARVERIQESVCAATILPEWESADIHTNDLVRVL